MGKACFLSILSIVADVVGIIGCAFSVIVFFRTGSIKKALEKKYKTQRKLTAYEQIRQQSMKELSDCCNCLSNHQGDLSYKEAMPYLERIGQVIADIKRYHPSLSESDKKAIGRIEEHIGVKNTARQFSYLAVIQDLHDIISMLKVEAIVDD